MPAYQAVGRDQEVFIQDAVPVVRQRRSVIHLAVAVRQHCDDPRRDFQFAIQVGDGVMIRYIITVRIANYCVAGYVAACAYVRLAARHRDRIHIVFINQTTGSVPVIGQRCGIIHLLVAIRGDCQRYEFCIYISSNDILTGYVEGYICTFLNRCQGTA